MDIETLAAFFMWCTIINGAMFVFSAAMCILARDFVYRVHSKWFAMPRETFNVIIYSWVGLFKIVFLVFNVVPYVALLIIG
ncbi:MAG: hypothetical protein V3U62_01655 [Sedimenticolaceae bacterium]